MAVGSGSIGWSGSARSWEARRDGVVGSPSLDVAHWNKPHSCDTQVSPRTIETLTRPDFLTHEIKEPPAVVVTSD